MTKCRYCSKNISEFAKWKNYCTNCGMEINELSNLIKELKNE